MLPDPNCYAGLLVFLLCCAVCSGACFALPATVLTRSTVRCYQQLFPSVSTSDPKLLGPTAAINQCHSPISHRQVAQLFNKKNLCATKSVSEYTRKHLIIIYNFATKSVKVSNTRHSVKWSALYLVQEDLSTLSSLSCKVIVPLPLLSRS